MTSASCGCGSDGSGGGADGLEDPLPRSAIKRIATTTTPTAPPNTSHRPRGADACAPVDTEACAADDSVVVESAKVGAVGLRTSNGGAFPAHDALVSSVPMAAASSLPEENRRAGSF